MKKTAVFLATITFLLAITATIFVACDTRGCKDPVLPKAENDKIINDNNYSYQGVNNYIPNNSNNNMFYKPS